MNYAKELVTNYATKIKNIQNNMNKTPLFPDRREPTKYLSYGYELILKMTFKLRVCFLEEMMFVFAFCYSKAKFEKVILDLEDMGYIQSETSKNYGKHWTLTSQALFYIYRDSDNPEDLTKISEDKLPTTDSKLYFLKIMNGCYAQKIFHDYVNYIWIDYKQQPKDFRNKYTKEQYIKYIVYAKEDSSGYSKTQAQDFTSKFLPVLESNEDEYKKYKTFISKIKPMLSDDLVKFSFLKDYFNQLNISRDTSVNNTLTIINGLFNNYYRDNYYTFREELYKKTSSSHMKEEYELFLLTDLLHIIKITKKSLLNSKLESKTEDELLELHNSISDIDDFIAKYTPRLEVLEENFTFMVFDKYNINDVAMYKEALISLDILRSNNIYIVDTIIQDSAKPKITFGIFQSSAEEMTCNYIFTRLEKIFRYYRKNLLSFDFEIVIYTYTNQHKELIETKLKSVCEDFKELTEYRFFVPIFDEITIISTKNHFQERYKVFEQFKQP